MIRVLRIVAALAVPRPAGVLRTGSWRRGTAEQRAVTAAGIELTDLAGGSRSAPRRCGQGSCLV